MALKVDRMQLQMVIDNDPARKKIFEIDKQIADLNKGLKGMKKNSEEYANTKNKIKELRMEQDKLRDSIGVSNMTMAELIRTQKNLNNLLRNLRPGTKEYEDLEKQIAEVNVRIKELRTSAKDTQNTLQKPVGKGGFFNVMKGVFAGNLLTKGAMMLADLATKARDFVREGVQMAAAAQGIEYAFNRIANQDYLKDLRRQTKGLLSDFILMKSAVRAENFDIPLSQLGTLLEFAQNRARDTGESVEYLAESIILGIGRKSPLILDNLGISAVRLREEVKKTGDMATAVGNVIEEEMAQAGPAIDTAADAATRKKVAWENLQLAVGNFFVGFRSGWDDFTTRFTEGLTKMLKGNESAIKLYDDQIKKVAELDLSIAGLADRYDTLSQKAVLNEEEQREIDNIMKQLVIIVPEAKGKFDDYGKSLSINTDKVREYITAERERITLLRQAALEDAKAELERTKRLRDMAQAQVEQGGKAVKVTSGRNVVITSWEVDEGTLGEAIEDLAKYGEAYRLAQEKYDQISGAAYERETAKRYQFNQMTKQQLKDWIDDENNAKDEFLTIAKEIYNGREEFDNLNKNKNKKIETPAADPFQEELKLLQEKQKKEILVLKQGLLEKGATEEEFRDETYKKEYAHLLEMKALYVEFEKDTVDIDMQITDRLISEANRKFKLQQDAAKENEKEIIAIQKDAEQTSVKEAKLLAEEAERKEKEAQERRHQVMEDVSQEHKQLIDVLYDLNEEWLNDFLDKWGVTASRMAEAGANIIGTAMNLNKAEEMSIERRYDKMIKAAGNNSRKVQQLEEEKEKKLHAVRAKYADKQFIITIANVIATTAESAMDAFKAMAGIPVVGPALGYVAAAAAVAYGASQIAIAKQQRDAAKEGYRTGGYTSRGDDRDEAGVVHRNEFVNTADAVRNPHVKRFLDVFNVAQKDGTIRMLNTTQILERARLNQNTSQRQSVYASPTPTEDLEREETLNRLRDSIDRFTEKLDIPIKTYTVIHGEQGARKQNELYDRIMKNASL